MKNRYTEAVQDMWGLGMAFVERELFTMVPQTSPFQIDSLNVERGALEGYAREPNPEDIQEARDEVGKRIFDNEMVPFVLTQVARRRSSQDN